MKVLNESRCIREFKAPEIYQVTRPGVRVFLAGSIEMDSAPKWQQKVTRSIQKDVELTDIDILNPRRDDWDSSWEQTVVDENFCVQVNWELDALETSQLIAMYFAPGTRSPITLLELGLHARQMHRPSRLIVCCPDGYWRQGNVQITCNKYGIPCFTSYDHWFREVRSMLLYHRSLLFLSRKTEELRGGF